jgi:hypothetical protein
MLLAIFSNYTWSSVALTGQPDWAIFRQLGDRFLWAVFFKITEVAQLPANFFSAEKAVY